jgi:hypothetical protein
MLLSRRGKSFPAVFLLISSLFQISFIFCNFSCTKKVKNHKVKLPKNEWDEFFRKGVSLENHRDY